MKIQQFQGGLSTRVQPQFLELNQGVIYNNIDNSTGVLVPIKKALATATEVEPYHTWYDAEQEWVSSTIRRDYVEYDSVLYWSDRASAPQKYNGVTQSNLGMTPPAKLTSFTISTIAPVKEVKATAIAGSGLPNIELEYAAINVNNGKFSDALLFTVKENGSTATTSMAAVPSVVFASVVGSTSVKAIKAASLTRNVVIKEPTGFTIGNGGVNVYRKYQGAYRLVGNLANSAATLTDSTEDISSAAELDQDAMQPLTGTYQYQMTYYNSADGSESAPSPTSAELDVTVSGTVTLSSLPTSTDTQVTHKRLYRIGGNLTQPTLVVELANATTTYLDELKDSDLPGDILSTSDSSPAPAGLAFLTEAYAMLFGAVDSKLRFTPIGKPDQWPELYFLQFKAPITGIAAVANGLLVFTKFKTYLVTGTGPLALSQQVLTNNQGCLAHESVQSIQGTAFWVSSDGLCASAGGEPIVVSRDALGKQALTVIGSVVHDEVYYALLDDYTMLAYDFGLGKIFKTFSLGLESIVVANDTLYGYKDGVLYELFASTEAESFTYKSPRYIEGSMVEQKTYKNIRFYHKGDIIIKIYIDDVLVATQQQTGEDSATIKVPQHKQRGNFIQFELTGTGEVHEIEYVAGERHNV